MPGRSLTEGAPGLTLQAAPTVASKFAALAIGPLPVAEKAPSSQQVAPPAEADPATLPQPVTTVASPSVATPATGLEAVAQPLVRPDGTIAGSPPPNARATEGPRAELVAPPGRSAPPEGAGTFGTPALLLLAILVGTLVLAFT